MADSIGETLVPNSCLPRCLTSLAAESVACALIYEDYTDRNFYRWDPVKIWQYYPPQPKRKKSKKSQTEDSPFHHGNYIYSHPPLPWHNLKKLSSWWRTVNYFGGSDCPLRNLITEALEKLSWSSSSEEEDVLFLILKLCIDSQLDIGWDSMRGVPVGWCAELILVIQELGPFPLQKLIVSSDLFGNKTVVPAILNFCPDLQVFRIRQWELTDDILLALGANCNQLQEFSIPAMEADIFMTDRVLFQCFFCGMEIEEVWACYESGTQPPLSFPNLKYVSLVYSKQTERFIQMLCLFYPQVLLNDVTGWLNKEESEGLFKYFVSIGAKINALVASCRTKDILEERLLPLVENVPSLRELRIHIDDIPDCDIESVFNVKLQEAGTKLEKLVGRVQLLNSIVIHPYSCIDIMPVVLPAFSAAGLNIKSLSLTYDAARISTSVLYHLVNHCPLLERLVVSANIEEGDQPAHSLRVELEPLPFLQTLVLFDVNSGVEEDDRLPLDSAFLKIARDVTNSAPNLKNLGLSCTESVHEGFFNISSTSVHCLHLHLATCSILYSHLFLRCLMVRFPRLKTLSLSWNGERTFGENLEALSHRGVKITRKKPEFFNVPRFDHIQSCQNVVVMVAI